MGYTVVWFKRDLRVHDHAPLHHAAAQGSVLCLYVIEPSLWAQPDAALQHYYFVPLLSGKSPGKLAQT